MRIWKFGLVCGAVCSLLAACSETLSMEEQRAASSQADWVSLAYAPAPADNPLKGFLPFSDGYTATDRPIINDFPHSMEWFYLPLKDLMSGPQSFTFESGLEPRLNAVAARGHQAVFRVYLDYPHKPSGIPQFLLDAGLSVRDYSFFGNRPGESLAPDYDDPQLVTALEAFIAELGRRYDGDPRVGFITLGLIGFWGEWHTWPMDGYTETGKPEEDWMPSEQTQLRLLKAFDAAFDQTRLLLRYPMGKPKRAQEPYLSTSMRIGYHDDSFAFETLFGEDWYFMSKIEDRGALNIWEREPIGGELRPEIQVGVWLDPPDPQAEDFNTAVDTTHVSWLIAHSLFVTEAVRGGIEERALAGAARMGYELYVSAVQLANPAAEAPLELGLRVQNTGVAPFYYSWPLQLGVLDASNNLVAVWDTPWQLPELLPASPGGERKLYTEWHFKQERHGLEPGAYTLALRAVNPLPNGKPLRFANAEQDRLLQGWLSLGAFVVTD
jgi:hypothetical protein